MIFSSSHDHGPALSFFKLPRSGASLSFTQAATITCLRYHFFFFPFYTATITGQFYHFLKQPRSRVCVIIFFFYIYCHDHGPVLSFPQAATITGLRYHLFFIYTASITGQISHFLMLPRSRASVSFSSSHDHGPAL